MSQNDTSNKPVTVVSRSFQEYSFDEAGDLVGYAATWNYDKDGIKFIPGSFKKTIAERAGKIPLLVRHDNNGDSVMETVGWIINGVEDEKGLLISAKFINTPLAQRVREQARAQGIKCLSVHAKPIKYDNSNGVLMTKEAFLREVTLTNIPADVEADIVSVREQQEPEDNSTTLDDQPSEPLQDTQDDKLRREALITILRIK